MWEKDLKIKHVDKMISELRPEYNVQRPKVGWLKLIRTTLGMSARALGERIGVSQARIAMIEKNEVEGLIKLDTLEKVADGLDCDVVYFLIPRSGSLNKFRIEQAYKQASKLDKRAELHMSLEAQATSISFQNKSIARLANEYLEKWPTNFWDDK